MRAKILSILFTLAAFWLCSAHSASAGSLTKGIVEKCLRAAFTQPKTSLEQKTYIDIESRLVALENEREPNRNELLALSEKWGCHFLEVGKVQEAIWLFDRTGRYDLSEYLVGRLTNIVQKTSSFKVVCATQPLWAHGGLMGRIHLASTQNPEKFAGVCSSYVVRLGHLRFLLKHQDPFFEASVRNEVLAFKVDRALGLNRVPFTIKLIIENKPVSLQLFVNDGHHDKRLEPLVRRYENVPELESLFVLDYLFNAGDRHSENILIGPDDRRIGLDNGRARFEEVEVGSYVDLARARTLTLSQKTKSILASISRLDLRTQLSSQLSPEEWDVFLSRWNIAQNIMVQLLRSLGIEGGWVRSADPKVRVAQTYLTQSMTQATPTMNRGISIANSLAAELRIKNYAVQIRKRTSESLQELRPLFSGDKRPNLQLYGVSMSANGVIFNEFGDSRWSLWSQNPPSYLLMLFQMYAEKKLSIWDVKALMGPCLVVDKRSVDQSVLLSLLKTPSSSDYRDQMNWTNTIETILREMSSEKVLKSKELQQFLFAFARSFKASTGTSFTNRELEPDLVKEAAVPLNPRTCEKVFQ